MSCLNITLARSLFPPGFTLKLRDLSLRGKISAVVSLMTKCVFCIYTCDHEFNLDFMKRRNFFKAVGKAAAIVALAPQLCFRAKAEAVKIAFEPLHECTVYRYLKNTYRWVHVSGPDIHDIRLLVSGEMVHLLDGDLLIFLRPRIPPAEPGVQFVALKTSTCQSEPRPR